MRIYTRVKRTVVRLLYSGLVLSGPAMMSLHEIEAPDPPADMYRNRAYEQTVADDIPAVRDALKRLSLDRPGPYTAPVKRYFGYYGLHIGGVEHRFGTFTAAGCTLAAHLWLPEEYRSLVIVLHGYLNHTGIVDRTIRHLAGEGYAVAAFDLPGHGLSGGPRVAVDSFAVYGEVLAGFLARLRGVTDKPVHIVAHSTGGAAVLQYLFSRPAEEDGLGAVVLAAPLIRSIMWEFSQFSCKMAEKNRDTVPRVVMVKLSGDKAFRKFIRKHDPLLAKEVPLVWVRSLFRWNERLLTVEVSSRPLTVIQGNWDMVVDWRYNIPFIREHFPSAEVHMMKHGRHELLNESEALRDGVMKRILERLEE